MEDKRRGRYVPIDVNVAFKRFGSRLDAKWGMEGLCAWMLLLAAAKREPTQGVFTYASEVEAWSKLGATASRFSFDEFITFCGRNKQTRKTAQGRVKYVQITAWGQWNNEWQREQDARRKSRKRALSAPDNPRTLSGLGPDDRRTETEAEYEGEYEPTVAGTFNIPDPLGKLINAMTDRDDLTVKRLSSMCEAHRFSEADFVAAMEAASGPGVVSPSAVALATLKRRSEAA